MIGNFSGHHHSEETKAKIGQASLGRTHSAETIAKMRGHTCSAETRAKMRGHTCSAETRTKISRALKGRSRAEEHRANLSKALKGRHLSEEWKANISRGNRGKRRNEEHKANYSKAKKGIPFTEEHLANMSKALTGKHLTEETKAKLCKAMKAFWQDPEYKDRARKAMRLGLQVHPNKPELVLLALLESLNTDWQYVGDGQLIVAGKNPDFWNGDHKLCEMWGDYWHKGQDPQDRIDLFSLYGYKTLIIWERELAKPEVVLRRIINFVG